MTTRSRLAAFFLPLALAAAVAAQPIAPGYSISTYTQQALGPSGGMDFAPDGWLYVGQEDNGAPRKIVRVSPGGATTEAYGEFDLADPDGAVVDRAGSVSGTAGAILVASGPDPATIWAILPDASRTTVALFGPSNLLADATYPRINASGRLFVPGPGREMLVSDGPGDFPHVLFTDTHDFAGYDLDAGGNIWLYLTDGTIRIRRPDGTVLAETFTSGLPAKFCALRFGPAGEAWGADAYAIPYGGESLHRIDADTGAHRQIGEGFRASDIAFGSNDDMYITHRPNASGGTTHVLRLHRCPADFTSDGVLNVFDFLGFQTRFSNGDLAADLTGEGTLNVFDFLAFQTAFGAGC